MQAVNPQEAPVGAPQLVGGCHVRHLKLQAHQPGPHRHLAASLVPGAPHGFGALKYVHQVEAGPGPGPHVVPHHLASCLNGVAGFAAAPSPQAPTAEPHQQQAAFYPPEAGAGESPAQSQQPVSQATACVQHGSARGQGHRLAQAPQRFRGRGEQGRIAPGLQRIQQQQQQRQPQPAPGSHGRHPGCRQHQRWQAREDHPTSPPGKRPALQPQRRKHAQHQRSARRPLQPGRCQQQRPSGRPGQNGGQRPTAPGA